MITNMLRLFYLSLFLLVALCGQANGHRDYPELRKSDANIVGHILDKNTKEHLPYITVALKGTTIGTVTDATGHYFLKNLPEGNFVLEVSSVGYKTIRRNVVLKKGRTLEEDFEIEEDLLLSMGSLFLPTGTRLPVVWLRHWSMWLI